MTQTAFDTALEDRTRSGGDSGEEELRFIRNFHDVFLSIGLGLFAAGLALFSILMIGNLVGIDFGEGLERGVRQPFMIGGVVFLVDAAVMWAVGEIFARTRRLFLPAIVILLTFMGFLLTGTGLLYVGVVGDIGNNISDWVKNAKVFPLVLAATGTIGIFLYYVRMKLPFAMGLAGASIAGLVVATAIFIDPAIVLNNLGLWGLGSGIFLFLLGVYFDARDPERRTRISDNGFWLHFFAAPLMFWSITNMVAGGGAFSSNDTFPAVATLLIVIVFAVISLLINRRALLVAGLLSAAAAIGVLFSNSGLDGAWSIAVTLLVLGGAMVLLGGGWKTVRRILIKPFPKTGWIARVIPPGTVID
ncbi:MAG: hypothetical protein AAFR20_00500 [Pseudomonadota bacterium]